VAAQQGSTRRSGVTSQGSALFDALNLAFLVLAAALCLFPIINVLSVSLSSSSAAAAGQVGIWPVEFSLSSYTYALTKKSFLTAFVVSLKRAALGISVNMLLTILAAYPLSKTKRELWGRNLYAWFFFFTMIFNGGLIPWYMVIKQVGLIDNILALILPSAVQVFFVLVLMNFFRQLPKEISESALIDGAGHWSIMWKIHVPLSLPSIATLVLFSFVFHWNSWFDGLILMTSPTRYPLQTYMQAILEVVDPLRLKGMTAEQIAELMKVSNRTLKSSQIFIAAAPVLAVYPFLQRYFMKGLLLGSVKG
jgi:putative aldouronate transport system permease protein